MLNRFSLWYRKAALKLVAAPQVDGSKNSFLSIIRRARVSEDSSKKKYAEYEVACQWRVVSTRVQKEIVYKWSVWKRYSEFEQLHANMRTSLGWQMQAVELPSTHTFVLNKLSPEFIEQRKDDLNAYWQRIISLDKVTDFNKHHCSHDLKNFLDVESSIRNGKVGKLLCISLLLYISHLYQSASVPHISVHS